MLASLGENAKNQPDEHTDGGVRQTRFEIEQLSYESGVSSAWSIFFEKESRRGGALPTRPSLALTREGEIVAMGIAAVYRPKRRCHNPRPRMDRRGFFFTLGGTVRARGLVSLGDDAASHEIEPRFTDFHTGKAY
jgi:hypothetical protein